MKPDLLDAVKAAYRAEDRAALARLRARAEGMPPGRTRDLALAWLFLAEAEQRLSAGRVPEAQAMFFTAYSYARTARDPEAFVRAREGVKRVLELRDPGPTKRRQRRR